MVQGAHSPKEQADDERPKSAWVEKDVKKQVQEEKMLVLNFVGHEE